MVEQVKNFIGGTWRDALSGETFVYYNPATASELAHAPKSTSQDIAMAVESARSALPRCGLTHAPRRGAILYRLAQSLTSRNDQLARLLTPEMGKIMALTLG